MLPVPGMLEEIELQSYGAEEMEYVCQCLQKNTSVTWGKNKIWSISSFENVWNIHQRAKACKNTFRIFQFHDPMSYPTLCEVTQLNASMNLIGDVGAKHVASMLSQSPKLPLARYLAKVTRCEWYLVMWWDVGMIFRASELIL